MIWNDRRIREWAENGGITPYDPIRVNPGSIDLCLGNFVRFPEEMGWSEQYKIHPDFGMVIEPERFVLLHSLETTHIPDNTVALLFLKSSTGRKGLEHLHCVSGDTKIDVPRDISKYPEGIPVQELENKTFKVCSFDAENMKFVLADATAFKMGKKRVIRVTYEWITGGRWKKESIVCTEDHRFLLLDGTWEEAKNLNGKRLRPFGRCVSDRYPLIFPNPLLPKNTYEHRFIASQLEKKDIGKKEVHHIDGNKLNNSIANLQIRERGEHQSEHGKGELNPFYGKQHTLETRAKISAAHKDKPLSEEHKRKLSKSLRWEKNPRYIEIPFSAICAHIEAGEKLLQIAEKFCVSQSTINYKIIKSGFSNFRELKTKLLQQSNHKVISVEKLRGKIETYDLFVPKYHNFVANGVVVHNCGYGDPGFVGQWTFEVINHWPFPQTIFPGQPLFQLVLCDTESAARPYSITGHYQNQTGATVPWEWENKR